MTSSGTVARTRTTPRAGALRRPALFLTAVLSTGMVWSTAALPASAVVAVPAASAAAAVPSLEDGPITAGQFAQAVQRAAGRGASAVRQAGGASLTVTPFQGAGRTGVVRQNLASGWVRIQTRDASGRVLATSYQRGRDVFTSPTELQAAALSYFRLRVPRYVADPTADRAFYPLLNLRGIRDTSRARLTSGLTGFTQTTTGTGVQLAASVAATGEQALYLVDGQGRLSRAQLPTVGSTPASTRSFTYTRPNFRIPSTRSVAAEADVDTAVYAFRVHRDTRDQARRNGVDPTTQMLLNVSRRTPAGAARVTRARGTVTVSSPLRVFTLQVFGSTVMVTFQPR